MSRVVVAAASCIALLGFMAVPAGAATVTSDTTMSCEDGTGRPDGMGYDSGSKRFTAPFLAVAEGARLSLTGASTPSACSLVITGNTLIAGTLDYDQRNPMSRAGNLTLLTGGAAYIPGTVSADGRSPTLGHGGNAGVVSIRAVGLSISGTISAVGGDGATAEVGDLTGGNGGNAGDITVTGDFSASLGSATLVSAPGTAGAGALLIPAGTPGTDDGTVRRNAPSGAGAGSVTAKRKPVNQAPTGLTASRSGDRQIVRWQDRSSEESGFVVVRRTGDGAVRTIGTTGPGAVSFTDSTPLPAGTRTLYAVLATFPTSVWANAIVISNAGAIVMPGAPDDPAPVSPPPSSDPGSGREPAATPVGVAIRRALRSGRRLAVTGTVDRRLAGERVELLVGTGSRLLGRAGLRVSRTGRVAVRGTMPSRMARTRSLLVAIRTPSTSRLRRETQIARVARRSPAGRATSGGRGRGRLTVSGRAREGLRGRVVLSVRYVDETGRIRTVRDVARHRGGRWIARVDMPRTARQGVITIATRGDLRHHGQGLVARLPGS